MSADRPAFTQPFWDAVASRTLALPKCSVCGRWQWYPEANGTDCEGGVLQWHVVASTGTLYSRTRVHRNFLPGAPIAVPYSVGLVDLDGVEGPRLVASVDDDVAIGDLVVARFEERAHGLHPVFGRAGV